ncbi:hypothetical protein SAMN05421853_102127 [Roseivivax halotolerans]|uniref:Uncharacterized protein n=1 Tax=Roseivivax halotolerans TaxID=93684 RepID=A0A1I5W658_9RHOB|nr:HEAT repeat domain-containing protein [Roseivivax halotolerans]SFQ14736.1 hypothetical protein SAMN05421853_102127 [Roseivivax halotolerans]
MPPTAGKGFIQELEAELLKVSIESGDNPRVKRALQTLCKLYWDGSRLMPQGRQSLEPTILGALVRSDSDEKVRRWSLSALAQLGRPEVSWSPVLQAIIQHEHEPQVVSAGIAAAFKLDGKAAFRELQAKDIVSPEFLAISAMQTAPHSLFEDNPPSLNVEEASVTTLKLSLILVGLERAPENLFHPKYQNNELIRSLSTHHDPLVSQYSIWAASENSSLGVLDVSVDVKDIEQMPPNIRSYIYRLYASNKEPIPLQNDVIEAASTDKDIEARLGAAIGLRDNAYDGIGPIVLDWFYDEEDTEVQKYLLDHISRQAERISDYHAHVPSLFSSFENDQTMRQVMLSATQGTDLYKTLRQMEYRENDLFSGGNTVTNNININNSGNMSGTSLSGQGDIDASRASNVANSGTMNWEQGLSAISDAREIIKDAPLPPDMLEATQSALDEAEKAPSEVTFKSAADSLETCEKALGSINGMAEKATSLAGKIALILKVIGL